ncbi:dihydropteroate synthase [Balneolales bacterium ANBcel1]|nr:dihydropteroate synthase [Balneolales bacterium ANBcel1]
MGILNVTPDSFSDGGHYAGTEPALQRIRQMVEEGAAIVDVGGESTRPGSDPVPEAEELARVIPVLERAVPEFPGVMFSVDTTKPEVARRALECGAHMVNDVSGLRAAPELADLCAEHRAALVIMHSRGTPKTMQQQTGYQDVVGEILEFLEQKVAYARSRGVESIVVDPGIGFGKTLEQNLQIMRHLHTFSRTGCPVLVGASRKSLIGQLLAGKDGPRPVDNRLAGSLALQYHALTLGATICRVHDVREARDVLDVFLALS